MNAPQKPRPRKRIDSLELIVFGLLAALVVSLAIPVFERVVRSEDTTVVPE